MHEQFIIRIGEQHYALDSSYETFQMIGKRPSTGCTHIPLGKFRIQDECWFLLWDKRTCSCYNPELNIHPFPLSVEWIKVEILSGSNEEKERVALVILLCETTERIRQQKSNLKKADQQLRKALLQFTNRTTR